MLFYNHDYLDDCVIIIQKMASLYSAQAAINARQKLNHEIEEGIFKGEVAVTSPHQKKSETHHPYHYKQTVHEKCKHHQNEGTLHKKLQEHIDHTKISEEREHQSSSLTHYREITEEREEVEGGMKKWARTIEACLKGQHKLSDKQLNQQHISFYKWLYFIEKLFRYFQNSMRTQTSIHSINQQTHSDKSLGQSIVSSQRINHKVPENQHDLKLPPIPTRQRTQALQKRIRQLQYQLQIAKTGNKVLLDKIGQTSSEWHKFQEAQKKKFDKLKRGSEKINAFLGELEVFNNDLLSDLNAAEKLKEYPIKIASNLTKLKEFREFLHERK